MPIYRQPEFLLGSWTAGMQGPVGCTGVCVSPRFLTPSKFTTCLRQSDGYTFRRFPLRLEHERVFLGPCLLSTPTERHCRCLDHRRVHWISWRVTLDCMMRITYQLFGSPGRSLLEARYTVRYLGVSVQGDSIAPGGASKDRPDNRAGLERGNAQVLRDNDSGFSLSISHQRPRRGS